MSSFFPRQPLLNSLLRNKWHLLCWTLLPPATIISLNDNVAETMFIYGTSMSPTLSPDYHETGKRDFVLFDKRNAANKLNRGDIVSLWAPHKPDNLVVKRVVGVHGDKIYLDARRMPKSDGGVVGETRRRHWTRMGRHDWGLLQARDDRHEMQFIAERRRRSDGDRPLCVTVPFGHVWLEGDNWRDSEDSNTYGPVSRSLVNGRAVCVLWPPGRFGLRLGAGQGADGSVNTTRVDVTGPVGVPGEWEGL